MGGAANVAWNCKELGAQTRLLSVVGRDEAGGKLAALPGGCRALLRFDVPEEADVPTEILGEVRLTSDDPMVADANARIVELALAFDPD